MGAWKEMESRYKGFPGLEREGLRPLLDRPWFRRIWILQEVANSKAAVCVLWQGVGLGTSLCDGAIPDEGEAGAPMSSCYRHDAWVVSDGVVVQRKTRPIHASPELWR